jgi:hypothetical protein
MSDGTRDKYRDKLGSVGLRAGLEEGGLRTQDVGLALLTPKLEVSSHYL